MERTEAFDVAGLNRLRVRLRWASAAVVCSNVEQFEVEITGRDCDKQLDGISVKAENGMLSIDQPVALPFTHSSRAKLQVRVFIPASWKGEVSAKTHSGSLEAVGLRGTDVTLTTSSGALEAASIEAINLNLHSASGMAHLSGASCEQLLLSSLSGPVRADDCDFRIARFHSAGGSGTLQAVAAFDRLSVFTASGDFQLCIPFDALDVSFRSASGRLRTSGIDLVQGSPEVSMNALSGSLIIAKQVHFHQENDMI